MQHILPLGSVFPTNLQLLPFLEAPPSLPWFQQPSEHLHALTCKMLAGFGRILQVLYVSFSALREFYAEEVGRLFLQEENPELVPGFDVHLLQKQAWSKLSLLLLVPGKMENFLQDKTTVFAKVLFKNFSFSTEVSLFCSFHRKFCEVWFQKLHNLICFFFQFLFTLS